jgi:hypothetical protein
MSVDLERRRQAVDGGAAVVDDAGGDARRSWPEKSVRANATDSTDTFAAFSPATDTA